MSTYIRAVVAAKAIADKYGIPLGDLVDTFADIPAADVVEVVRCRDCKHWDSETWFCDNHSTFDHHGLEWNMFSEDDFCSYGERKDGDGNG